MAGDPQAVTQPDRCAGRLFIMLLAVAFAMAFAPARLHAAAQVGDQADIEFTSVEGMKINRAWLDGQIVIVHFWASWYNPSIADLPTLLDLQGRYGHKGLSIIGVSLDTDSLDRDLAIEKHGVSWPQFCDRQGWDSPMVEQWGINSIPMAFILDTDGTIVWRGEPGNIRGPFQQVWQRMLSKDAAKPARPTKAADSSYDSSKSADAKRHSPSNSDKSSWDNDTSSTTQTSKQATVKENPVLDAKTLALRAAADEARKRIAAEGASRLKAVESLELAQQVLERGDAAAMLDMIDSVDDAAVGDKQVIAAAKQLAGLLSQKVRTSREVQDLLMQRPASVHRLQVLIDPSRRIPNVEGAIGESDGTGMHPIIADEKYRKAERYRDQERHYEAYLLYQELDKRAAHLEPGIQARTELAKYRSRPVLIKAVEDGKREYQARQALSHAEAFLGQGDHEKARVAYERVIETFEGTIAASQADSALRALR